MKATIGIMAAVMLLTLGMVSAYTETDISFYQASGSSHVMTYAQDEGNYWNWPSQPAPETSTGFVQTDITNTGSFDFDQRIVQYGNGQQWPNAEAIGEWSMKEAQQLSGSGNTEYNKHFEAWTVHNGWSTDYTGGGSWNMPEGLDTYAFAGDVVSTTHTVFNYGVGTDSAFVASSGVWINPFTV